MNKRGFTLLEVSLFFAITGLLALVAFAGLGPRLRNVRFTDAVRTLESTNQKQLSDFQSGVNLRSANISCSSSGGKPNLKDDSSSQTAGSSADCIVNGRLAVLSGSGARYYPVVSTRRADTGCSAVTVEDTLFCHWPTVVGFSSSVTEIDYRNGASSKSDDIGLLYIQDPNGTTTKLMGFNTANISGLVGTHLVSRADDILELPQSICLTLSGRTAQVQYNKSSLQPTVNFDEGC